ncbi:MAG: LCP family protein [Chloroflexaceae bacterium]|nr:LCP family protein [Chloroflexaceae bacterium]
MLPPLRPYRPIRERSSSRTPPRTAREYPARRRRLAAPSARPRPKRRGGGCGVILLGLVLVLVIVGVGIGMAVHRFNELARNVVMPDPRYAPQGPDATIVPAHLPDILREPFNVLLVGVDKRDGENEGARSDTLIVVHVHPDEHWASMLSIPRDSVASIRHLGQTKINAAYTHGYLYAEDIYGAGTPPDAGAGRLAAETVEQFLGAGKVEIHYIAQVDFSGFEKIIDTLGGVPVDVSQPLLDAEYPTENFGRERIFIPVGLQVLDGRTALRYARSRHSGSDFERSRRQQQVLQAMLKEVQRRGLLEQVELFPQFMDILQQSVMTTMPINDLGVIHGLARLAQSIQPEQIVRLSINPDDVQVVREQGSDIYWNQQDVATMVERLLAGPAGEARVQVLNGAGTPGLATRVTYSLNTQGFWMADASDAPGLYEHTMVIDYTGCPYVRQSLADLIGLQSGFVYEQPPPDAPPAPTHADIVVVLGKDYGQLNWAEAP